MEKLSNIVKGVVIYSTAFIILVIAILCLGIAIVNFYSGIFITRQVVEAYYWYYYVGLGLLFISYLLFYDTDWEKNSRMDESQENTQNEVFGLGNNDLRNTDTAQLYA